MKAETVVRKVNNARYLRGSACVRFGAAIGEIYCTRASYIIEDVFYLYQGKALIGYFHAPSVKRVL